MRLVLKRNQKSTGLTGSKVVFALDARVDLSEEEKHLVKKYKLGSTVIYNSVKSAKHLETAGQIAGGSLLRGTVALAMHRLSLNISVDSLTKGHHIECKDLEEILGAEEAVMAGCNMLRTYLDTAATFDGQEIVIDFDQEQIAA